MIPCKNIPEINQNAWWREKKGGREGLLSLILNHLSSYTFIKTYELKQTFIMTYMCEEKC